MFESTIWALLPAFIAIVLALKTKEVYLSLFFGIISGALLISEFNLLMATEIIFDTMIQSIRSDGSIGILIFLILLGIIVCLISKSGASIAYANWVQKKLKTKRSVLGATFALGTIIFIDDYFNCLTVGSVMKDITDSYNISRAKLAYIIDSTAAPICIIAPISSWAAAVSGYTSGDGFTLFLMTIPFNLYALLTIIMVIYVIVKDKNYGLMEECEKKAQLIEPITIHHEETKAKIYDLLLPILFLIVSSVVTMLYIGGFFDGVDFVSAFAACDAPTALVLASFYTLCFIFVLYIPRKIISYKTFAENIPEGFKTMVPAICILALAWTLGSIVSEGLNAGVFVSNFMMQANIPYTILPATLFVCAMLLAFSTGTSWGTFGILIPIATSIFLETDIMLVICIASILAGAVCGDHISPISDTTIMASAGAQCDHIEHVESQLPYALLVAAASFIGFIVAGFTLNVYLTFASALLSLVIIISIYNKINCK